MRPLDFASLERLANRHRRAWEDMAASTGALLALPLQTFGLLAGWPEADAEPQSAPPAEPDRLVAELRQAYRLLEEECARQAAAQREEMSLAVYQTLEPLLLQLPLVRHAVAEGREVAAADLLALLGPLDRVIAELGLVAIGAVGEALPYDPRRHQMATGAPPEAGTLVSVRHVGFCHGERILRRARVALHPTTTTTTAGATA